MLTPSIFSSATYAGGSPSASVPASPRRTRSSKARSSSSEYALSRLSIGSAWVTLSKPKATRPPTRCVGESGVIEIRMRRLEVRQLTHERVELGVGDLRRAVDVIQLLVMANQAAELLKAFFRRHAQCLFARAGARAQTSSGRARPRSLGDT